MRRCDAHGVSIAAWRAVPTQAMKHIMATWADAANKEMINNMATADDASGTVNSQSHIEANVRTCQDHCTAAFLDGHRRRRDGDSNRREAGGDVPAAPRSVAWGAEVHKFWTCRRGLRCASRGASTCVGTWP